MDLNWPMLMIYPKPDKRCITINVIRWSLKNQLLKIDDFFYSLSIITFAAKLIAVGSIKQNIFLFLRVESIYGD